MLKTSSKSPKNSQKPKNPKKTPQNPKKSPKTSQNPKKTSQKSQPSASKSSKSQTTPKSKKSKKSKKFSLPKFSSPFKSFHRAYREDYADDFTPPSLISHAGATFSAIFKNWKFFGALLAIFVIFAILFVGLLDENTISSVKSTIDATSSALADGKDPGTFAKSGLLLIATATTGGLGQGISEGQGIILALIFLLVWLATTYFLRFRLAGQKVTVRDCLYNSFAPLASTFVVLVVIIIELIPAALTAVAYNSAIQTDFLSTPFYALLFIAFAGLLLLLSGYLVSSSIIALVAVSSPGLYPLPALKQTYELMYRRRIKFILRIFFLFLIIALIFVVIMLPVILLDGLLKSCSDVFSSIPVISFFLLTTTCFCFIYASAYVYLYYRRMLDYESK